MENIPVKVKVDPYQIMVGAGIIARLGKTVKALSLGKDAVVITSAKIRKLHGRIVERSLLRVGCTVKVFEVPDGEVSKSAPVALKLLEKIASYDVSRRIFVVALGGGVIGDLAGFVAAVYKRGVPYIQVPTTLLAQIDSAIGGKTAIDLKIGKNLVGAFYQPKAVVSDIAVLRTLSRRQIRNALAEAVKYGVIYDPKLFAYLEKNLSKVFRYDLSVLRHIVTECSRIKAGVVAIDEKETKGVRMILNFGHTLGHAIEAAGGFKVYQHGEAISLGIRAAIFISVRMGALSAREGSRIEKLLKSIGLPDRLAGISAKKILVHMRHDKKFVAGKNRFVLARRIGKVSVVEGVPQRTIEASIESIC